MAVTESDIIRDEQERSNLLRVIGDVETAIAVSTPGTRHVLDNTLENAKKRVVALDKKIADAKVEQHAEQQALSVAASLVAKETALNAREQVAYAGFLKEDFFSRKDFGKLDEFYAHTWDRLSEGGKDQMSHRIWEGVRQNEFHFSDLPDAVKEREEKQAYRRLHDPSVGSVGPTNIPAQDQADFLRAYEAGDHKKAAEILNRKSFQGSMFLKSDTSEIKHSDVVRSHAADADAIAKNSSIDAPTKQSTQPAPSDSLASLDLGSVDLSGLTAADHPADGAVSSLPRIRNGNVRGS